VLFVPNFLFLLFLDEMFGIISCSIDVTKVVGWRPLKYHDHGRSNNVRKAFREAEHLDVLEISRSICWSDQRLDA
jgi:hypothetical protein